MHVFFDPVIQVVNFLSWHRHNKCHTISKISSSI